MVMASINGRMATATKANGKTVSNTAMGQISSQTATNIQVNTVLANLMVLVSINGQILLLSLETSKTVSSMAKENGRKLDSKIVTNTKVNMPMTRKMETVHSPGKAETYIKAAIPMTSAMAMVKCTGPMALFTKANGARASSMAMVR